MDIVAFIRARLDEDEQVARAAPGPQWDAGDGYLGVAGGRNLVWGEHTEGFVDVEASAHIARHDPARVLREVEAKRVILGKHQHQRFTEPLSAESKFEDDHRPAFDEAPRYVGCVTCSYDFRYEEAYPSWWCEHARLLALPYADHPDYREEWRP